MIRESPPECLVDPELGRHLYIKINVSDECSLPCSILMFLGLQIPLCWKRIPEEPPCHLSPRFYWFLVRVEKPIKRAVKVILGCCTWFKGIRGLWETLFISELFRWRYHWGNKEVCWHHSWEKGEDCSFGTWPRRANWMETCRKVPRDGHQVRLYLHPSSEDLAESPDQILDKHDPEQMALWVSASFPAWAANGGQWPRSFWQKIQEMEQHSRSCKLF